MADFSFLSDTDDSAVEELISQTKELCVLEQVSAINCSGFTDSLLPTELESRFRKLKSFPAATKPRPKKPSTLPPSTTDPKSPSDSKKKSVEGEKDSDEDTENFMPPSQQNLHEEMSLKPLEGSDSASGNENFSPLKENPDGKRGSRKIPEEKQRSKSKSKSGSFSPASDSSNSWMDSPSPPRTTGCLWCSPKRSSSYRKKNKENRVMGTGLDWGSNDEFLSDLSVFSEKERQRMLKKAMKEEEKISREAEKIVKWAKQASARMSASRIGDELSDED